jgi:hypothetical protein
MAEEADGQDAPGAADGHGGIRLAWPVQAVQYMPIGSWWVGWVVV